MSKFVGKFRKNHEYRDDYEYSQKANKKKRTKHKVREHAEIKKQIKQWELENHQDYEL
jgi:hypothetical protein